MERLGEGGDEGSEMRLKGDKAEEERKWKERRRGERERAREREPPASADRMQPGTNPLPPGGGEVG